MADYTTIEGIMALPQNGNSGPEGWGFHMWSDKLDDEAPHRLVLERFAATHPEADIKLPPYDRYEDYVEATAEWNGGTIEIYYETILSYLWLWSSDRAAVSTFREALLPLPNERTSVPQSVTKARNGRDRAKADVGHRWGIALDRARASHGF